ncbi:MAG: LamG domain-containing protein [Thermoguttaceae bacterium]
MMLHRLHRTLLLVTAICLASPPTYAGLVGDWTFDGTLQDSSGMNNNGTFYGGAATYGADRQGTAGKAIQFDGIDDRVGVGANGRPTNNFSFGGWIKTALTHEIDTETNASTSGVGGQHFAFGAQNKAENAGAGLSIGTNGISVYEHGNSYMPALAVYNPGNSTAVGTGWNHVLVVYQDRQPTIYLNGVPVRTGVTSAKATVYAPIDIGGGTPYGWLNGAMDDVKVWNYALSPADVAKLAGRTTLVTNGSFERDTFANWPGYISGNAKLSHWTTSTEDRVGLSPSTNAGPNGEAQDTFANNGLIPDGNQVAFLQSTANQVSLTQSVSGFDPGQQYLVVYRENARAGKAKPDVSVTLGGQTVVTSHAVTPVEAEKSFTKPYRYIASSLFTASGATHDLQFTAANATADSAALIDAVQVLPMYLAFSDNFNVQATNAAINPNPANDLPGRQGGFVGPRNYTEVSPNYTQLLATETSSTLRLGMVGGWASQASPDCNFKGFSSDPMHFVLEVDVDPTTGSGSVNPWAGVILGSSSQTASVNGSDGIGMLFRDSGGYQIFDGTDGVNDSKQSGDLGSFGIDKNDWYHVRINYYVPAFDDVTPGNVAIFVDDKLVYSATTDSGFLNNYLVLLGTLEGGMASADHGFDNLRLWVNAVPEPSTCVLVGLGGLGLLVVRKKRGRIVSSESEGSL